VCEQVVCGQVGCGEVVCEQVVREGGGGRRRRQPGVDDQKTRTSHKDVGKKNEHESTPEFVLPWWVSCAASPSHFSKNKVKQEIKYQGQQK